MRAVVYDEFAKLPTIQIVPDPSPQEHGVVLRVKATGLCRSDWHGWMGHDPDITLPHVPGYEIAEVVEAVGKNVVRLIGKTISLDESAIELSIMNNFSGAGVTVINQF